MTTSRPTEGPRCPPPGGRWELGRWAGRPERLTGKWSPRNAASDGIARSHASIHSGLVAQHVPGANAAPGAIRMVHARARAAEGCELVRSCAELVAAVAGCPSVRAGAARCLETPASRSPVNTGFLRDNATGDAPGPTSSVALASARDALATDRISTARHIGVTPASLSWDSPCHTGHPGRWLNRQSLGAVLCHLSCGSLPPPTPTQDRAAIVRTRPVAHQDGTRATRSGLPPPRGREGFLGGSVGLSGWVTRPSSEGP